MIRSSKTPMTVRVIGIALLVYGALIAGSVSSTLAAQTIDWDNAAGGLFADGTNWAGGVAPGMTDSARFALPNTYSVDFAGLGVTNDDLFATAGDVELTSSLGLPTYELTGMATITGSLSLGTIELAVGDLLIDGGQFSAGAGSLFTLAPVGQLTLENSGQLDFAINLDLVGATVTVDGAGTMLSVSGADLNLTNGSQLLVSNDAIVAVDRLFAPAAGIQASGGAHIATGATELGGGGSAGALSLLDGTTADLGTTDVAVSMTAGTDGVLTIESGASATADDVNVATEGLSGQSGTLQVGGTLTQNGAAAMTLGAASEQATSGQLLIDEGGQVTTGTGTLTVNQTGTITNAGGTLGVSGDFLLDGGVYEETHESAALGLAAGTTWTIQNGGRATYQPESTLSLGADRALVVDGMDSAIENVDDIAVGTTAGARSRLTLQNDASLTFDDLSLSETTDGSDARLEVLDGATLTVNERLGVASAGLGSTATVQIDGEDSLLDYDGMEALRVGSASGGAAELSVGDTATLDLGNQDLHVGATGTVRLDNAQVIPGGDILVEGGRIEQTAADTGEIDMPAPGGALRVVAGGSVDLVQDLTMDGASIQVDAVGSTLNVAGEVAIESDSASSAGLVAANQATVTAEALDVGSAATPAAAATARVLSGAALSADTIRVGDPDGLGTAATAHLEVSGGGSRVELGAGGTMTVGANGGTLANQGVVDLVAGGTLDTSAGTLAIRSSGVININGGTLTTAPIATGQGIVAFDTGTIDWRGDFGVGVAGLLGTDVDLTTEQELIVAGTTTIDPSAALTVNGGALDTNTLVANGDFAFLAGRLRLAGQNLTVAAGGLLGGDVTLGPDKHLTVDQTVEVDTAATVEVAGGTLRTGTLSNSGHVVYDSGQLEVTSSLANQETGRIFVGSGRTLATDAAVANAGRIELGGTGARLAGSGAVTNTGLVTGDGYIHTPLENAAGGELRAAAGDTLSVTGATTANAGLVNLLGGTVEFSQAFTNGSEGRIAGHGTALFDGGLDNQGRMQFSAHTVDIYGDVANTAAGQIITSGGGVTTFYGNVVNNGAEIRTSTGSRSVFFGDVTGAGPFTGDGLVQFEGDVFPGNSPAAVVFEGDLSFGAGSQITFEIGGTTPGSEYDTLLVDGTATLDGTLLVELIDDFVPDVDDVFTLMTFGGHVGQFSSIDAASDLGNLELEAIYTDTSLLLSFSLASVPGDANGDGLVDGVDYLVWANHLGAMNPPDDIDGAMHGDFNGDGIVDGTDYLVWAGNYNPGAVNVVPEPAGWLLLITAALALVVVMVANSQARRA